MTLSEIRERAIAPALAMLPARMSEKRAQVGRRMLNYPAILGGHMSKETFASDSCTSE